MEHFVVVIFLETPFDSLSLSNRSLRATGRGTLPEYDCDSWANQPTAAELEHPLITGLIVLGHRTSPVPTMGQACFVISLRAFAVAATQPGPDCPKPSDSAPPWSRSRSQSVCLTGKRGTAGAGTSGSGRACTLCPHNLLCDSLRTVLPCDS